MAPEASKIFLGRTDGLEVAVDKIIRARGESVVLNVPKGSALGSAASNFQVLKRESATAKKRLTVESIDDRVLELSALARITASNPIFKSRAERPTLDIVRRAPKVKRASSAPAERDIKVRNFDEAPTEVPLCVEVEAPREAEEGVVKPSRFRRNVLLIVIVLSIISAAWGAYVRLPRATITLELKTRSAPIDETLDINKKYGEVATVGGVLQVPAELFVQKGNIALDFPASGVMKVNNKAAGTITVYNAYSSVPQPLVAQTRFETPDGKMFRLDKGVTIPGAKVVNGKIEPSMLDVAVSAAEPGEAYNIGPVTRWTIPGFKGTPRFAGFYGESASAMTGGVVGERSVPSDADRAAGEKKVEDALNTSLQKMLLVMAGPYKALPGSTHFAVTNKNVQLGDKDEKKFSIFMEGEIREIVFDESTLKSALTEEVSGGAKDRERVADMALQYGTPEYDFVNGAIRVHATGSVTLIAAVATDTLRESLAGEDEAAARASLSELQGLKSGTLELWPFWVHAVPSDLARITINVK